MDFAGYGECPVADVMKINSLFTFFRRKFSVGFSFKGERHDFFEAVCVLDGKVGVTADKQIRILSAGQMILHPPGEFHAIWSDCGGEPEILIVSFGAESFPANGRSVYALSPERVTELKEIFRAAQQAFELEGIAVKRVADGREREASGVIKRLELFFLTLLSADTPADAERPKRGAENYYRILSVMEKSLGKPLTVGEIAKACGLSVPTVEKTVYRYAGCGAMRYYNQMRMKRAAEMLERGASVKEVALTLGFSDQNYFSSRFKKWSGHAPSLR